MVSIVLHVNAQTLINIRAEDFMHDSWLLTR